MKLNLRTTAAVCLAIAGFSDPGLNAADFATSVAALNPVAYYRLNSTNAVPAELAAVNQGALGSAFNGEYQAMAGARGVAGAIVGDADTAVSVVGSVGQQVVVPFSAAYNPNGPFTVEFWAKPANTDAGNHTVAISMVNGENPANGDDRSGWCVRHNGADWQVLLGYDHSDGATFYGTQLFATGTAVAEVWQHVVTVYDGAAISIYVNGAQVATQAPEKPMLPNTGAPLIIGDRGYTGWDYSGLVDELAIYTAALSAAEIKAHYDNGVNAARTKPYADLVQEKAPALYFRLGEPSLELPVAVNTGSLGTAADGRYLAGTVPGVAGPRQPAVNGFDATNGAVRLNGTSGSVQIPGLALNTDSVTMLCWLKRDGKQPTRAGIMHNRKVTAPEVKATGLGFQDDGLALSYNWEDLGTTYNFNPGFVPPDKSWTFYAVTVSPAEAVMFMGTANGLVAATNAIEHLAHDFSGTTLELGWDNYEATRVFRGELDEFAMFDKTLTYDQVKALFEAALPAVLGITRTPVDPVYEGLDVTFQVAVASPTAVTIQWRKDGQTLTGKTATSLQLSGVTTADSGTYDVVVTTGGTTLTSESVSLQVLASAPVLTQLPASAVRFINGAVSFSVEALGSEPKSYTWKHGNDVITGATGRTLVLSDLQPADAGDYTVTVANVLGSTNATASLTLVSPTQYAAAAVDAGPMGYWKLDEASGTVAYDYWGGRDGTFGAGVTNGVPGPRPGAFAGFESANMAYALNGAGGKVVIPPLNLNKATATIVTWINPDGAQPDYAGVVFSRGGAVSGLDYKGPTDQLGYHWNDAANTYNWESGLSPTHNQWNFVALVVEPSKATMYLDGGTGLQPSENVVDHGPSSWDGTVQLGQDGTSGRLFKGSIDEVTIYDRALSLAEVTALRNAGFTGAYAPKPVAIVEQPKGETILVGAEYALVAKVTGSVPITYQWQKGGQDLPGAIRSSLVFPSATEADSGTYQLVVSQGATKITSSPATLTVKPVPTYINLPENLVVHLKFDGDYQDSSGRNNNGTAVGSPQSVSGIIGSGAVRYNTVVEGGAVTAANYVTLGTPSDLNFGAATSLSVAFWTKFTGSPGDLPFLCNNDSSYGGSGFVFAPSWETGSWSWSLNDGSSPAGWPGVAAQYGDEAGYPNVLNDGQWHHLVFRVDRAGDVTTFADGVKVHRKPIAGLTFNLDTGLEIQIGQAAGVYAVAGDFQMDDLGIWRRVLSDYDAQAIYLVGRNYGRSFDVAAPPEVRLTWQVSGSNLVLGWTNGTLEEATEVTGAWTTVPGASAPTHTVTPSPDTPRKFYRVKVSN